ncbi:MAG: hypothetical protein K9L86_07745 [Candidatus Omnitrophica bacterium]|nr:hypothetical protein [Candidatus Omnitrophota bacterium]
MKVWILIIGVSLALLFTITPVAIAFGDKTTDFQELRSEHFMIRYQDGVSKDYVYDIKKTGEKFYRIITQQFNLIRDKLWLWDNRAQVFIAKDQKEYLSKFGCSSWSGACVNYKAKIIYTYPNQKSFNSIFIHELTHIILHEYAGRNRLSLWLDEGVATYIEDKYSMGLYQRRLSYLQNAIKQGKHIPLSELIRTTSSVLTKKSADYVSLFYVESFSIVNFFSKRYGKYKFSNFLSRLKHGESIESAISKSFSDCRNYEELEKQWIKFYLK